MTHAAERQLRFRLLGGGGWATAGKLVTIGAGFLVSALVARILTPTDVGAYFLSSSVVLVASMIARLGLGRTVSRAIAAGLAQGHPERARAALSATLRLGAASSIVVGGLFVIDLADRLGRHVFDTTAFGRTAGLLGIWLALLALQGLLAEVFRGLHDIRGATLIGGAVTSVATLSAFSAVYAFGVRTDLPTVIGLSVAATALSVLVGGYWAVQRGLSFPAGGPSYTASALIKDGLPVVVANVTGHVVIWSGMWVVGGLMTERDVAVYGAATRLSFMLNTPLNIVNQVVPPVITELHVKGEKRPLERLLRASAALGFAPALAVAALLFVAAEPAMGLLFGPDYAAGGSTMVVLSVGQLIGVWAGSCAVTLVMTGNQRALMAISVAAAVTSLIACWVAGAYAGVMGVAWALTGVILLQQLATLIMTRRLCGIWTHASFPLLAREARRLFVQ